MSSNMDALTERLVNNNDLNNWLSRLPEAVFENEDRTDPLKCTRRTAQAVMTILGAGATAAFWPVNMETGNVIGGGKTIGTLATIGNTVAFWVLQVNSGNDIVEEKAGAKTDVEWHLSRGDIRSKVGQIAQISLAALVSISNAIPSILAARKYRSQDEDGRVTTVVVTTLGLSLLLFPLDSMYRSIESIHQRRSLEPVALKLLNIKDELSKRIRSKEFALASNSQATLNALNALSLTESDKPEAYWKYLCDSAEATEVLSKGQQAAIKVGNFVGAALGLVFIGGLSDFTHYQVKKETDSEGGAAACAVFVALSNLFSTQKYIQAMSAITALKIYNTVTCTPSQKTLAKELRPKITSCLGLLSMLTSVFALGATIVIYNGNLDRTKSEKVSMATFMCTGLFTILFNVLLENVDKLVHQLILYNGSDLEKDLVLKLKSLHRVAVGLKHASLLDTAYFAKSLSAETLNDFDLTLQKLDSYIRKYEQDFIHA